MDVFGNNNDIARNVGVRVSSKIEAYYKLYFICRLSTLLCLLAFDLYYELFTLATVINLITLIFELYLIIRFNKINSGLYFCFYFLLIFFNFITASVQGKEAGVAILCYSHMIGLIYFFGIRKSWILMVILLFEIFIVSSINYYTDYAFLYNPIYTLEIQKKEYNLIIVLTVFLTLSLALLIVKTLFIFINLYFRKIQDYNKIIEKTKHETNFKKQYQDPELISLAQTNSMSFYTRFCLENLDIFSQLTSEKYKLNDNEISVCAYILLNFNSTDIAKYTNVSLKSVESKKYRIRKKLNLPPNLILCDTTLRNIVENTNQLLHSKTLN